jgi:glycosyltransferase involved in cell wall biosynthesis
VLKKLSAFIKKYWRIPSMQIGVDARPLSYDLTGIGVYLKHLLAALQKIDDQNHYFLFSNGLIDLTLDNRKWSKIEGGSTRRLLSTPWMQLRGTVIAAEKGINLFWSPRHHLPLFLPSRIKTVITIHDITHLLFPATMSLPNLLVERLLMGPSLRKADSVIADSNSTAQGIRAHYPVDSDKVITIYPGKPDLPDPATDAFHSPLDLPPRFFLFVGTLDPRKNLLRVLNAFEQIDPQMHDVHLVIVGGQGWKNRQFYQQLNTNQNKNRVVMTGFVSRQQLKLIYENAVCLLFPSVYEGFGFPILEAMSCGSPVITSRTASMPEVAGDAAMLVDPIDTGAIASAMLEIMTNTALRDTLITKGYQRLDNFSWEKCAQETLRVFERVHNE